MTSAAGRGIHPEEITKRAVNPLPVYAITSAANTIAARRRRGLRRMSIPTPNAIAAHAKRVFIAGHRLMNHIRRILPLAHQEARWSGGAQDHEAADGQAYNLLTIETTSSSVAP
jgi:hypothetical protein